MIDKKEKKERQAVVNMTGGIDRGAWLVKVDNYTAIEYLNKCYATFKNDTNDASIVIGMAHSTINYKMEPKGIFYTATTKQWIMSTPFTLEESTFLKDLFKNGGTVAPASLPASLPVIDKGSLAYKIAEIQESDVLCGESKNRTFNIDTDLYNKFFQFTTLMKETKGIKAKDIIVVAVNDFMEKYCSDFVYNPEKQKEYEEKERAKQELIAKKRKIKTKIK